jgi:hypothetical protein
MEQRSLRLGDTVDDYCPRERRVTDHVIVAIVEDTVRQTRCTACDAEHEYKEARVPRKKMKNGEMSDLAGACWWFRDRRRKWRDDRRAGRNAAQDDTNTAAGSHSLSPASSAAETMGKTDNRR